MASWLAIKNWSEFQHYKDRNPPWIKLHRALLDDYAFAALPDAHKAHLVLLWLFAASQVGGRIPNDAAFLSRKLGTTEQIDLEALVNAGFLIPEQNASDVLAERKQNASDVLALARSRESESESEGEKRTATSASADPLPCPAEKIVVAYHRLMPDNPKCKTLNATRRGAIKARWHEAAKLTCRPFGYSGVQDGLKAWEAFFAICADSAFLTGQAKPQPGKPPFLADIDFLFSPKGFAGCIENKYHREAA